MKVLLLAIFFHMGLLMLLDNCQAQKKSDAPEAYFPTENTSSKSKDDKENIPKKKVYSVLYKYSLKGTLYGNPCAQEETMRMGFIYVVHPKGWLPTNRPWPVVVLNNIWVNTKLIVTRSPFWKLILKKRIDECREKTGDIVG